MTSCRPDRSSPHAPRWLFGLPARLLVGLLAGLLTTGCASGGLGSSGGSTSRDASASPTADLTRPGAAQAAVQQLTAKAGSAPVIRITVTKLDATLTYVANQQAVTLDWDDGQDTPVDSGITYVDQQPFNPADFDLSDVGALFAQASTVAGSSTDQELQINEYNQGKVLMTVTTTPESQTIFFRPDGTMIDAVDFTTTAGIAEALADTAGDSNQIVQIGIDATQFWADIRIDQTTIEHRVRPPKLPAYTVTRNATTKNQTFAASQIDPAVVANLMATLPAKLGNPKSTISMVMDTRDGLGYPVMRFTVGLTTVAYTVDGTDITNQIS